ncbi:DUF3800 domain-containing protein, partial [Candidatus Woesearchaeota archaeon]|nr:DUF3800 domain-containing protein [Candidatus Woesearchaeota archaeon]
MPNNPLYKHYTDISGTLKSRRDDIIIGSILFNDRFKPSFREQFYAEFASLRSFKKKGTNLKEDKLKEIIKFMNNKNIKMSSVYLPRHIINNCERRVKALIAKKKHIRGKHVSIRSFHERLIGLAYFQALKPFSKKNYPYDSFFCQETQFQMQEPFSVIMRMGHKTNYFFRPAMVPRRTEHMIKFADFVASAKKKVDSFLLGPLKNYSTVKYEPTDEELLLAFKVSQHSQSK